jgi:two-component system, NtrC family, response regulator AtoC
MSPDSDDSRPHQVRVAVVDDEPVALKSLCRILGKYYAVQGFDGAEAFLSTLKTTPFPIVLSDVRMPGMDGLELLAAVQERSPYTEVILCTGYASIDNAVQAIKRGAFDYIEKPLTPESVLAVVRRASEKLRLLDEERRQRGSLLRGDHVREILGSAAAIREMIRIINKVSKIDCNVLIQGESGTGKELVARAIHYGSARKDQPFVGLNCGGFSEELVANELFGHERGAYTGAEKVKAGLFEAAQGGTVFLDEVAEMPISTQVKLLRVIQEKKVYRLGGAKPVDVNMRIVSATNKDLEYEARSGRFREDLFFRLKVVVIRTPPLRERQEDIPLLAEHFLRRFNTLYNKNVQGIAKRAMDVLLNYPFPGNVRELEHIICSAVALSDGKRIDLCDLPDDLATLEVKTLERREIGTLAEQEEAYIRKVLEATNYNKIRAAKILDIPRTTLWRKIKKFKIQDIR